MSVAKLTRHMIQCGGDDDDSNNDVNVDKDEQYDGQHADQTGECSVNQDNIHPFL